MNLNVNFGARGLGIFAVVLVALFAWPLFMLGRYAMGTDLHSHVVLIPLISGWLFWQDREKILARVSPPAKGLALGCIVVAGILWGLWCGGGGLSENDSLAMVAFGFVLAVVAGGFLFLGWEGMRAGAFAFGFLVFTVPLLDVATEHIENILVLGSAEVSDWLFQLSRTPIFREGTILQLPGIVLEVARECSGIRSSWVLFITSVLAAHMLLKNNWHRAIILLVIVPLGIARNGIRILTIGLLCVHVSPEMVHSFIHKKGGPIFFALSLIPLFALLWFLWKRENRKGKTV